MIVLADESVRSLDKKVTRVSFCCVEFVDGDILNDIRNYVESIKNDPIRFGGVDKMHFSSMSEAQQSLIIEYISKINITAKVFVYYFYNISEKDSKIQSADRTIMNILHIHRGKKIDIQLEAASEYKDSQIAKDFLSREEDLFIVPDGMLSVFLGHLDNTSGRTGANDRMYTLIKEKIRLQVFHFDQKRDFLTSTERV